MAAAKRAGQYNQTSCVKDDWVDRGGGDGEKDKGGRGVREGMFGSASGPALKKGWGCWGREPEVDAAHEAEIQLNYTRTECIFNHGAPFPDVTVGLCARLWGIFWVRSCHLSLSLSLVRPFYRSHSSLDQQHNTQQLWQELIWCRDISQLPKKKKIH